MKAVSLGERAALVRDAFREAMGEDCCSYVTEVYDDYAIICEEYGEYYRAGYTMNNGEVIPSTEDTWMPVEMEWIDIPGDTATMETGMMSINLKSAFGSEVKALGDGKVGGHLVLFSKSGELDLTGEYFDDSTDFDLSDSARTSIYYQHGQDRKLKIRKIGSAAIGKDDLGIWIEGQLDLRDDYERAVYGLVETGKVGWSSGTAPHLVDYEQTEHGRRIKRWPLGLDASITPTPADPRQVVTLKAYLRDKPGTQANSKPDATVSDTAKAVIPAAKQSAGDSPVIEVKSEDKPMTDNAQTPADDGLKTRVDGLESTLRNVDDNMNTIMDLLSKTPKGEGQVYTNMGGKADARVKSLGDFCLAMMRGDETRLKSVYNAQKALAEDQGATGGYMIPSDFSAQLITGQAMVSPILGLVRTYPVQAPAGEWPVLDIYTAPTAGAGNSAFAGQLVSTVIAEAGTFTDRNVKFKVINWRVAKVGDILNVSSEMAEDAQALDALLRDVMTTALAARKERGIIRGNGVAEPLGILNAPATISYNPATSNVFAYADSIGMVARFRNMSGDRNRVRWLYHISVLPDLAGFQTGSAGTSLVQSISNTDAKAMQLWSYALQESEHAPQANNDGSVVLCDFGSYGIWQRGQIDISFSTDYAFNTDQVTWRFKERYDGRPLAVSSVTLADPTGSYTVSPFVSLSATHV